MDFNGAVQAIKGPYSQQIMAAYGYTDLRTKYTVLEPEMHQNGDAHPSMGLCRIGDNYRLKDFAGIKKSYSPIDLIMIKEGLTFGRAVRKGAEICGIDIVNSSKNPRKSDMDHMIDRLYNQAQKDGFAVGKITARHHYEYKDADGKRLYDKYRIDYIDGNGVKHKYIQVGVEKNGYVDKIPAGGYSKMIAMYGDYRQYGPGDRAIIVEGEQCVDVCHNHGMTNVMTPGGSGDWAARGAAYAPYFAGADVVILQDNDSAGESLTRDIIASLSSAAGSIKVVVPDTSAPGADIADYFAGGGTLTDLEKMIEATPGIEIQNKNESVGLDLERYHIQKNGVPVGVYHARVADNIIATYPMMVIDVPYIYQHGVYMPDDKLTRLKSLIKDRIYKDLQKAYTINQICTLIIDDNRIQADIDSVNNYPDTWINFADCMVDASTMQEIPHAPKYRAINQIPWEWQNIKNAKIGKNIELFLSESIPDIDDREMYLEYSGLTMTKDTRQQVALFVCGLGGTGKSKLLRLNEEMVGRANTANITLQGLSRRFSTALLVGKLLNVYADIPSDALEETATFKGLTGEDRIFAERKGYQGFMCENYARLIFSMNLLPAINGERNNAFFRRLLVIKIDNIPRDPNPDLMSRLLPEIPYLIRISVEALHRMYQRGTIIRSPNSQEAVAQMQDDADSTAAFVRRCCVVGPDYRSDRSMLYAAYTDYCRTEERQSLGKIGFFRALRSKGYAEVKSHTGRQFRGIVLAKYAANAAMMDGFVPTNIDGIGNLPLD